MMASALIDNQVVDSSFGYVGRIPVRNLWLLMLYASDLQVAQGDRQVRIDDVPEDIPDLVAEILVRAVEDRHSRQLSLGFEKRQEILNRVRGRIDAATTFRHQLLSRGRVACKFEELTVDTPRNRFVRCALEMAAHLTKNKERVHQCRKLAHELGAMGVSSIAPTQREIGAIQYGRHDMHDRPMVSAAKLIFEMALPTEASGQNALPNPNREDAWVRGLFERAVGGFYKVVLSKTEWSVKTGQRLEWQTEKKSARVDDILPNMKTDIVLEQYSSPRRIVIDTKFASILTSGWYREETIRNGYLYQIYSYVRSQAGNGDVLSERAEGVLLHPSIGESIDEEAVIQGHRIRFMTVDLAKETATFRSDLLRLVQPIKVS